jgi:hypothetical protein
VATPYLRRMTLSNGWRGQLVRDRHGEFVAIVAVRIGPTWTDAVAIEGEDRCPDPGRSSVELPPRIPIKLPTTGRFQRAIQLGGMARRRAKADQPWSADHQLSSRC